MDGEIHSSHVEFGGASSPAAARTALEPLKAMPEVEVRKSESSGVNKKGEYIHRIELLFGGKPITLPALQIKTEKKISGLREELQMLAPSEAARRDEILKEIGTLEKGLLGREAGGGQVDGGGLYAQFKAKKLYQIGDATDPSKSLPTQPSRLQRAWQWMTHSSQHFYVPHNKWDSNLEAAIKKTFPDVQVKVEAEKKFLGPNQYKITFIKSGGEEINFSQLRLLTANKVNRLSGVITDRTKQLNLAKFSLKDAQARYDNPNVKPERKPSEDELHKIKETVKELEASVEELGNAHVAAEILESDLRPQEAYIDQHRSLKEKVSHFQMDHQFKIKYPQHFESIEGNLRAGFVGERVQLHRLPDGRFEIRDGESQLSHNEVLSRAVEKREILLFQLDTHQYIADSKNAKREQLRLEKRKYPLDSEQAVAISKEIDTLATEIDEAKHKIGGLDKQTRALQTFITDFKHYAKEETLSTGRNVAINVVKGIALLSVALPILKWIGSPGSARLRLPGTVGSERLGEVFKELESEGYHLDRTLVGRDAVTVSRHGKVVSRTELLQAIERRIDNIQQKQLGLAFRSEEMNSEDGKTVPRAKMEETYSNKMVRLQKIASVINEGTEEYSNIKTLMKLGFAFIFAGLSVGTQHAMNNKVEVHRAKGWVDTIHGRGSSGISSRSGSMEHMQNFQLKEAALALESGLKGKRTIVSDKIHEEKELTFSQESRIRETMILFAMRDTKFIPDHYKFFEKLQKILPHIEIMVPTGTGDLRLFSTKNLSKAALAVIDKAIKEGKENGTAIYDSITKDTYWNKNPRELKVLHAVLLHQIESHPNVETYYKNLSVSLEKYKAMQKADPTKAKTLDPFAIAVLQGAITTTGIESHGFPRAYRKLVEMARSPQTTPEDREILAQAFKNQGNYFLKLAIENKDVAAIKFILQHRLFKDISADLSEGLSKTMKHAIHYVPYKVLVKIGNSSLSNAEKEDIYRTMFATCEVNDEMENLINHLYETGHSKLAEELVLQKLQQTPDAIKDDIKAGTVANLIKYIDPETPPPPQPGKPPESTLDRLDIVTRSLMARDDGAAVKELYKQMIAGKSPEDQAFIFQRMFPNVNQETTPAEVTDAIVNKHIDIEKKKQEMCQLQAAKIGTWPLLNAAFGEGEDMAKMSVDQIKDKVKNKLFLTNCQHKSLGAYANSGTSPTFAAGVLAAEEELRAEKIPAGVVSTLKRISDHIEGGGKLDSTAGIGIQRACLDAGTKIPSLKRAMDQFKNGEIDQKRLVAILGHEMRESTLNLATAVGQIKYFVTPGSGKLDSPIIQGAYEMVASKIPPLKEAMEKYKNGEISKGQLDKLLTLYMNNLSDGPMYAKDLKGRLAIQEMSLYLGQELDNLYGFEKPCFAQAVAYYNYLDSSAHGGTAALAVVGKVGGSTLAAWLLPFAGASTFAKDAILIPLQLAGLALGASAAVELKGRMRAKWEENADGLNRELREYHDQKAAGTLKPKKPEDLALEKESMEKARVEHPLPPPSGSLSAGEAIEYAKMHMGHKRWVGLEARGGIHMRFEGGTYDTPKALEYLQAAVYHTANGKRVANSDKPFRGGEGDKLLDAYQEIASYPTPTLRDQMMNTLFDGLETEDQMMRIFDPILKNKSQAKQMVQSFITSRIDQAKSGTAPLTLTQYKACLLMAARIGDRDLKNKLLTIRNLRAAFETTGGWSRTDVQNILATAEEHASHSEYADILKDVLDDMNRANAKILAEDVTGKQKIVNPTQVRGGGIEIGGIKIGGKRAHDVVTLDRAIAFDKALGRNSVRPGSYVYAYLERTKSKELASYFEGTLIGAIKATINFESGSFADAVAMKGAIIGAGIPMPGGALLGAGIALAGLSFCVMGGGFVLGIGSGKGVQAGWEAILDSMNGYKDQLTQLGVTLDEAQLASLQATSTQMISEGFRKGIISKVQTQLDALKARKANGENVSFRDITRLEEMVKQMHISTDGTFGPPMFEKLLNLINKADLSDATRMAIQGQVNDLLKSPEKVCQLVFTPENQKKLNTIVGAGQRLSPAQQQAGIADIKARQEAAAAAGEPLSLGDLLIKSASLAQEAVKALNIPPPHPGAPLIPDPTVLVRIEQQAAKIVAQDALKAAEAVVKAPELAEMQQKIAKLEKQLAKKDENLETEKMKDITSSGMEAIRLGAKAKMDRIKIAEQAEEVKVKAKEAASASPRGVQVKPRGEIKPVMPKEPLKVDRAKKLTATEIEAAKIKTEQDDIINNERDGLKTRYATCLRQDAYLKLSASPSQAQRAQAIRAKEEKNMQIRSAVDDIQAEEDYRPGFIASLWNENKDMMKAFGYSQKHADDSAKKQAEEIEKKKANVVAQNQQNVIVE